MKTTVPNNSSHTVAIAAINEIKKILSSVAFVLLQLKELLIKCRNTSQNVQLLRLLKRVLALELASPSKTLKLFSVLLMEMFNCATLEVSVDSPKTRENVNME
ncbi:hypothetical protein NPIL_474961 [Nephila pilipes]|uniref:Uncharacterized protein n=1 Tax=Nephila pilipes TaxID=299642 RepID=A0A8X6T7Y0_NEPPI|nr:hypothetical protein NPIL_474961 [Nephila pilipes]